MYMERVITRGRPAGLGYASGVLREWSGKRPESDSIVVVNSVSPSSALCLIHAKGVVTRGGGVAGHGIRILREFGVPTITGVGDGSLPIGDIVTVDAEHGLLLRGSVEPTPEPEETPSTRTRVYASIGRHIDPDLLDAADGVSSLRTNYLFLEEGVHPRWLVQQGRQQELEDMLYEHAERVARLLHPRPVWYKLLDLPTDEYRTLRRGEEEPREPNPIIGYRGLYRELNEPELLHAELNVLQHLQEADLDNVILKLPFVRREWEVESFLDVLAPYDLAFGVNVETPGIIYSLPRLLDMGASFASIGVNDLTTCMLGADRNNEKVTPLYSDTDPSVLDAITRIIRACERTDAEVALAGWYSHELLAYAIKEGVDIVSASQAEVHVIRRRVASIEADS